MSAAPQFWLSGDVRIDTARLLDAVSADPLLEWRVVGDAIRSVDIEMLELVMACGLGTVPDAKGLIHGAAAGALPWLMQGVLLGVGADLEVKNDEGQGVVQYLLEMGEEARAQSFSALCARCRPEGSVLERARKARALPPVLTLRASAPGG
jgi:hypothetical protein